MCPYAWPPFLYTVENKIEENCMYGSMWWRSAEKWGLINFLLYFFVCYLFITKKIHQQFLRICLWGGVWWGVCFKNSQNKVMIFMKLMYINLSTAFPYLSFFLSHCVSQANQRNFGIGECIIPLVMFELKFAWRCQIKSSKTYFPASAMNWITT